MRTRCLLMTMLAGLALGALALAAAPSVDRVAPQDIARLIEQLGSGNFAEREEANRKLDAIGAPALEALRKAAQSNDAEVRRRAEDLVKKIEKLAENNQLLTPSRVRLVYNDTPVTEAVADLAKKSGYPLTLHDPQKKLAGRKVTLDTGEVSFWEAVDQLCQKAGLVEAGPQDLIPQPTPRPLPRPTPLPRPIPQPLPGKLPIQKQAPAPAPQPIEQPRPEEQAAIAIAGAVAQVAQQGQAQPGAPGVAPAVQPQIAPVPPPLVPGRPLPTVAPNQLVLTDGKPQAVPTSYSGAVRVRALPGVGTRRADEVALILQVTPEPKIQWQNLVAVRIDKAVDDQGQNLQAMADENPADPNVAIGRVAFVVARPGIGGPTIHQQVPVRLKRMAKASKSLKELEGTISAQVWAAPKPMITVGNLFKAVGETIKGEDGGWIKVVEATRNPNGQIRVRLEMETPANVLPAGQQGGGIGGFGGVIQPGGLIQILPIQVQPLPVPPPPPAPGNGLQFQQQAQPAQAAPIQIQIQIAPAIDVAPGYNIGAQGLTLVNEQGQEVKPTSATQQLRRNGNQVTREYVLTFPAQKGETAKLVFSASRSVTLDIPFKLKDVPLP